MTLPLALISPDAVILPLKVWVSEIASPNMFDPSVCIIEEVTIEEVILVTFKLTASIEPTVILGVPAKPVAVPVKVPMNELAVITPLALILPDACNELEITPDGKVADTFVNSEPSPDIDRAVIVPLALILPDAVMWRTSLILLLSKSRSLLAVWLPKLSPPATAAANEAETSVNSPKDKVPSISTLELKVALPVTPKLPDISTSPSFTSNLTPSLKSLIWSIDSPGALKSLIINDAV